MAKVRSRWALCFNLDQFKPAPYIRGFNPLLTTETEEEHGFVIERTIVKTNDQLLYEKKRKQSSKIFMKYFPDFQGDLPFFRDEFFELGYDDDAKLIENERMYSQWISDCEGEVCDSHSGQVYAIDLMGDVINRENVIGKKWIVVVDCHY